MSHESTHAAALAASPGPAVSPVATAVWQELARALAALEADASFEHLVDLASLPIDPQSLQGLRSALGLGEVSAQISSGGTTHVQETAWAGIWWLRHEAPDGRTLFEQLSVARVPSLLHAQPDDIREAAAQMARRAHEEYPHE